MSRRERATPAKAAKSEQGFLWADGKRHPEPPPSSEPFQAASASPPPPPADVSAAGEPMAAPVHAPVPANFSFTDRSRLRSQALDFAIRAAALMRHQVANGAAILQDAEDIERWIANP